MINETTLELSEASKRLLSAMPGRSAAALFKGMQQAMMIWEATAKIPYLTGKALKVRTGHLRRSIVTDVARSGNTTTGVIGTNVVYGRLWELGYSGPMQVKSHARRIRQAFGKPIEPRVIQVKAHVRDVTIRPRPFMRPALKEKLEQMGRVISRQIEKEAANGG